MGNTNGTLSLVFGIVGLCCCGFIFGPLAIILGALGLKKDDEQALSIIGIVLGVIGLICWLILIFFMAALMQSLLGGNYYF